MSRLPQCCHWDRHPQRWIRNLITGICLLANGLLTCEQTAAIQPSILPRRAPNVVMIVIDDQNDWIGCLNGHPQAKTPHIDRLAKRGTLFLNAHFQSPLCNPARTSVMTGLRPSSTGNCGLSPGFRETAALRTATTLPQHFRNQGYETLMAGKIYHGAYGRRAADHEYDIVGPPAEVGPRPELPLVETPSRHPLVDWGTFPHHDEEKGDWKLPEPRLSFLQEASQWRNLVRAYLASTAFADAQVGRMIDALDASPFADNTIRVLWSDHGWHLGEKGITEKNTLWERSTRVPLIFSGPKIAANATCLQPAELLDIYPTLKDRILLYDAATGHVSWEGEAILPGSPVPEVED